MCFDVLRCWVARTEVFSPHILLRHFGGRGFLTDHVKDRQPLEIYETLEENGVVYATVVNCYSHAYDSPKRRPEPLAPHANPRVGGESCQAFEFPRAGWTFFESSHLRCQGCFCCRPPMWWCETADGCHNYLQTTLRLQERGTCAAQLLRSVLNAGRADLHWTTIHGLFTILAQQTQRRLDK